MEIGLWIGSPITAGVENRGALGSIRPTLFGAKINHALEGISALGDESRTNDQP
jgi:hypothetical protein